MAGDLVPRRPTDLAQTSGFGQPENGSHLAPTRKEAERQLLAQRFSAEKTARALMYMAEVADLDGHLANQTIERAYADAATYEEVEPEAKRLIRESTRRRVANYLASAEQIVEQGARAQHHYVGQDTLRDEEQGKPGLLRRMGLL